MMKQRLERTDVCCRIRWSHREQTSFWERQVSSSLQVSQKRDEHLASSLRFGLWKVQMSPARFQQGWRICVSKKQQQHLPVDAGRNCIYRFTITPWLLDILCALTPGFHFGWESHKCQENRRCFRGFPHKSPTGMEKKQHLKSQTHKFLITNIIFSCCHTETHCETWTTWSRNHPDKDICSFKRLQKTSNIL